MLIAVVVADLLGTLIAGAALSTKIKSASDYLVAGRNLGLALTTASLAAVQIGAGVVLGGAETGAASGVWPGTWYGLGCGAGLILAGLFAARRLRTIGGIVPIDFSPRVTAKTAACGCGRGSRTSRACSVFCAAQMMAAGSVLSGLGISYTTAVLAIGSIATGPRAAAKSAACRPA